MLQYKSQENDDFSTKTFINEENERTDELQKTKSDIDESLVKCFTNISIAYKSGNTIRLLNLLSHLNKFTLMNYFDPCSEFFLNSIPDILMNISFDKSNKFPLKCKVKALSIIESLTFEEQYGFFHLFYNLGIINSACFNLFSEDFELILYSIRILINYFENQNSYAEEITKTCSLCRFIRYILRINIKDENLERRTKYYAVLFLCKLSFISKDKFTNCFYVSVDYLLNYSSLYQKRCNIDKFIFLIVINCMQSDHKLIEQFINNINLVNLIIDTINNNHNFTLFQLAIIILNKFYQKPDFIIQELDLSILVSSISSYNYDDLNLIHLLHVIKKHLMFFKYISFLYDQKFISALSQLFDISNFSIRAPIIELLCLIIEYSPNDFLKCLVHENIIQKIFEMYFSEYIDLKNILLNSLARLLDSVSYLNNQDRSFFLSQLNEVDFSIIEEEEEDENLNLMIRNLKKLYENCMKLQNDSYYSQIDFNNDY